VTEENCTPLLLPAVPKFLWYVSNIHVNAPTLFRPHLVELRGIGIQSHVDDDLFRSNLVLVSSVRMGGKIEGGIQPEESTSRLPCARQSTRAYFGRHVGHGRSVSQDTS